MGPRPAGTSASDKLENLQRRHQILEGEKRSIEETAAVQIKASKDAIRRLHETNNKLREEISASVSSAKGSSEASSNMEELIKLKNKFNAVRSENMRKEQLVEQLKKQVEIISSNSTSEEISVTDRRIRVLENRIDKAMIKYNEAQSIKKTYEGILHRLKEERVGFDHQLENLEKQLEAKKKDYEELLLLSHDALHAKEMAQAELHRFEQAVMEERNQRDREVMEKKLLVQQRIEMNHRLERKEKETVLVNNNVAHTVVAGESIFLPEQPKISHPAPDETQKIQQRLSEYEEAYSKLKEVTGVSDVNEIIQKFISQEITYSNLTKLTREQEKNIQALNEEHDKLKGQLDELKFSAAALTNGRHFSASVDAESLVAESMSKLEKNRTRYEKLAKVLIDVNSGVGHLHDKLSWIKLEDQQPSEHLVLTDETIEEILNVCELKVTKLMQYVDRSHVVSAKMAEPTPDIRVRGPGDGSANVDDVDFEPGAPSGTGIDNDFFNRKLIKSNSALFVDKVKKYVLISNTDTAFHIGSKPI